MFRSLSYGVASWLSKAAIAVCLAGSVAAQTEVLALGDSLTQGYGLPAEQGFVPQLEAWLRARGHDVTIVNAGVSGDTSAGGLARVEWSLTPETDAMIVTLGGNDLLRGLDPSMTRANIRGILEIARGRGLPVLLVGMEAPGNFGPDYKQAFDSLYPELAEEYGVPFFPRFFEGVMSGGGTPADLAPFLQPDGIHPNAAGVARIVEAIGPAVERLISGR